MEDNFKFLIQLKKVLRFNSSHRCTILPCRVTLNKEVSSLIARQDDIFFRWKLSLSALATINISVPPKLNISLVKAFSKKIYKKQN